MRIDTSRLAENARRIKEECGVKLCAVVKANGYGHGIRRAAQAFAECADMFAVSNASEAAEISSFSKDILLLSGVTRDDCESAVRGGYIITVKSVADILNIETACKNTGKVAKVHIKADTGMNRLGVKTLSEIAALFNATEHSNYIQVTGMYSHFYTSKRCETEIQFNRFMSLKKAVEGRNLLFHMASTSTCGIRRYGLDMVRVGLGLYEGASCVSSDVLQVKRLKKGEHVSYDGMFTAECGCHIAVIRLGYADGVKRGLSNRGFFVINDRRYKVIGNICMDMCVVLCDEQVKEGDTAFYYGDGLTALEQAENAGTVPYDIYTSIGERVERIYV